MLEYPQARFSRQRRLRLALTALVAGAMVLTGSSAASAAPTKAKPTITMKVSTSTISPDRAVKLAVVLRVRGKAVKGAVVKVQERRQGTSRWKTVAKAKTNRAGRATVTSKKRNKNTQYRAVFGGSRTVAARTSRAKTVRVKQRIDITGTSKATLTAGETVQISGNTSAALAGQTIRLQLFSGDQWTTVATAKVSTSRTFSVSARATQGGAVKYRVHAAGGAGVSATASASRTFDVYQWFSLADLSPTTRSKNFVTQGTVALGGQSIAKTVGPLWAHGGWGGLKAGNAEYNLSYRCTTFQATVGVPDTSGRKASWGFHVAADDVALADTYAVLAKPQRLNLDVTGAFRLVLSNDRITGDPYQDYEGDASWGAARILCLGQP